MLGLLAVSTSSGGALQLLDQPSQVLHGSVWMGLERWAFRKDPNDGMARPTTALDVQGGVVGRPSRSSPGGNFVLAASNMGGSGSPRAIALVSDAVSTAARSEPTAGHRPSGIGNVASRLRCV